jgi:hypothetical protein
MPARPVPGGAGLRFAIFYTKLHDRLLPKPA